MKILLYSGRWNRISNKQKKYNKNCLVKNKTDKKGNEYQEYSTNMLEAKLVVEEMVFSVGSEFVENEGFNIQKMEHLIQDIYMV